MHSIGKRGRLTVLGIGIVCVLCGLGVLSLRLLTGIFPASVFPPHLGPEQPLGDGEAIAFSYMRVNMLRPFELYLFDDVHGIRSLSRGLRRSDVGPVWSPDGTRIAYRSLSGSAAGYYLVDPDGTNRREIARDDRPTELLRWSPDSSRLAYVTYARHAAGAVSHSSNLCVTDVISGDTHHTPAGDIQGLVWMPDGQSLVAIERADEQVAIAVYGADGNQQRRISAAYLRDASCVAISPDAGRVAYVTPLANGDAPQTDLLSVSALDGSTIQSLPVSWTEGPIVWSPDGTRIAFVALTNDFEYALYVVNTDGMELVELMSINTGDESGEIAPAAPAWSPDGTRIAISSFGPQGAVILTMNADGTERRQITRNTGFDGMIYDLAWRPKE